MRKSTLFILGLVATSIWGTKAHTQSANKSVKPARILFLVDVSSSMLYDWQPEEIRMKAVGRLVNDIIDSLTFYNPNIDFALRLIGSQYPAQRKICTDTKLEVGFGTYNGTQLIKHKTATLKPYGFTPIAYALLQAAEKDFINSSEYNYSIILITDGGESCNGDICAVMQEIVNKKISFKPYILSMVKDIDLEKQYECLGTYVNILEQKDFNVAINKIIGENSVILNIPKTAPQPATPKVVAKEPLKPTPNTNVVPKERVPDVSITAKKPEPVPVQVPTPTPTPIPEPEIEIPDAQRVVFRKNLKRYTVILTDKPLPKTPPIPIVDLLPEVAPTPLAVAPTPKPVAPTPKPVAPKPVTPRPTNTVTSKPTPPTSIKLEPTPPREMTVTNVSTASEKTQLRVKFVTNTGKEIFTEPEMTFTNINTKATRKERRTVAAGTKAIAPITLEAGDYKLQIGNSTDYTKDITILPNQLNTVTIQVNSASLIFRYTGNKERPMKEYTALVSNRFSQQRTNTKQPCDTKVYYEPASYHVEVNTLPPSMYFLDLEFGVTKVIEIPENGTVKFTNTKPVGPVELYYQLGDAFKHFKNMQINGNVANQTLELLPGNYQARFYHPETREKSTVAFRINSLKDTNIEL